MSRNDDNDSIILSAAEVADISNQIEQLQQQLDLLNIRLKTGTHRQQSNGTEERIARRRRHRRPISLGDHVVITNSYGGNRGVTGEIQSISSTRTTVVVLTFELKGIERRQLRKHINNVRCIRGENVNEQQRN